ncbi:MAG: ABC transporter permease [Gemmatimonadetes bacterium]|nr:ABC transporter permease [Gemmatimonadota bacterium]
MNWKRLPRVPRPFRRQVEQDLDAELDFHLEEAVDDLVAEGWSPEEARRRARAQLKGLFAARRALLPGASGVERRRRVQAGLSDTWGDVREACSGLLATPGFSLVAVGTLALAIGASTGIFSVAHAVMFRPLPYDQPETLVALYETEGGYDRNSLSTGTYLDWRAGASGLQEVGVYSFTQRLSSTDVDGRPSRVQTVSVTPSAFVVLGVPPVLGRPLEEVDGTPDAGRVALLSWNFWRSRFGADPGVLGRALELDGESHEIVGVMGPGFVLSDHSVQVWRNLRFAGVSDGQNRRTHQWRGVARLASGATIQRVDAEIDAISAGLEDEFPAEMLGWRGNVVPLHGAITRSARPLLWVLLGFVGVVLLMACANLASLLLARFSVGRRDLAVRSALGAGRARLVRRALVESGVVALAGGALGVVAGAVLLRLFVGIAPPDIPRLEGARMDPAVLVFAAAVTLFSALAFGVLPAFRSTAVDPASALKEGGRGDVGGSGQGRLRSAILVAQVAMSTVLLVGAGLLLRSMSAYQAVDYGYEPDGLIAAWVDLPPAAYPARPEQDAFYQALLDALSGAPDVEAVTATTEPPVTGYQMTFSIAIESMPRPGEDPFEDAVDVRVVQPGYFGVVGQPLRRGRALGPVDDAASTPVVVINEALARRHWAGGDPLGDRISFDGPEGPWFEVVGVAGDVRHRASDPDRPALYLAHGQRPWDWMRWQSVLIRTELPPGAVADVVTSAVWRVDGALPVDPPRRVSEFYAESRAQSRFAAQLLVSFALVGLLLGSIGLYGVLAYSVGARRREIGVRLALGGSRGAVLAMVLRFGVGLCLAGLAVGIPVAVAGGRLVEGLVFGVGTRDAVTYLSIPAVLLAVALLASWIPARRAAALDPASVLRED